MIFYKFDDRNESIGYDPLSKGSEQKSKVNNYKDKYVMIENYYGAHKNFKTDFKNKKYRNVYNQLIISKPSQPEHKPLYYQDMLISIVKTIQSSFMSKENSIQSIVPFMNIGTKIIIEFYWLFLKQRRIIDQQLTIDPIMKNKITNFLTLIIDFSSKVSQYLDSTGDFKNSQQIFQNCYKNIVAHVLSSSTSNLLLLKKCGQFLLQYALHCLNTKNDDKAHELLRNGLKAQLNILIILKFNINHKKDSKKWQKKYGSALKNLINVYICLAIYYQRVNNIYQSSTLILDAVLIEELISKYNDKCKKWVCNLEQSYIQQKCKHLELMRICNGFFCRQSLKELNQSTTQYFSNDFISPDSFDFLKSHQKLNVNKNQFFEDKSKLILKQNNIQKGYKKNQQNKINKQKIVKQVRFKLGAEELQQNRHKKNNQIQKKEIHQNYQPHLNHILKSNLLFEDISSENDGMQVIKFQQGSDKKWGNFNKESKTKKSSNDILLFGQNFWELQQKNLKRSKSNFQKLSKRQQFQFRRPGRKLSYTNVNYLQIKTGQKAKNKTVTTYLKQNYNNNTLRKKTKDKGIFLQKKNQIPQDFNVMNKKIKQWHEKSTAIETDTMIKKHKLNQRRNIKNIFQSCFPNEEISNQISMQQQSKQLAVSKIENELQNKKNKENNLKTKKPNGIKLFKQYLVDNKNYFNITKTQLFTSNLDLQNQKRFLSFLVAQKPQKIQKYFEKNHWQAKQNIEFFLKDIQNSNKRFKQNQWKKSKSFMENKKAKQSTIQYLQAQKVQAIQNIPKNLFSTSIKGRVNQMIKYF